ncbi:helix-turn-helix domain-containing protein [Thermophilibacter provencensis]|uniref:Helix-turn-helix domain-containing protein n=1 Tax=Thermophilibacter provencensis TaxID=1852386 RepID=A0ABT7V1J4_9ACTN|nr:helix-turn-helix domain-containing protein [Thermophilibacter provencensis]MDM8270484.1 helix-turn-helix domain-containing protein [Thermophilibacter provencensis]
MLLGVFEFEIVKDDSGYVAIPYDLGGATQGDSMDELCHMVVDWLKMTLEDYDMKGLSLPTATFGNAPRYGGFNMVFAVQAGRETVEKITATEAARLLGISRARITQLLGASLLEGYREGRNTYVTMASVKARLRDRGNRDEMSQVEVPAAAE